MRSIDWRVWVGLGVTGVLAGCSSPMTPTSAPPGSAASPTAAAAPAGTGAQAGRSSSSSSSTTSSKGVVETVALPAPGPVRSWDELRRQAAHRIVQANPHGTYTGTVPDALLAIPVLEIELKRDGSISRILILRPPREAKDTSELAIAAVHRAAPFGDVSKLPRPWKFTETFLFNDDRKFKPRTLDE